MSEEVRQRLAGPIPSIRTPFDKDGAIDFNALARVVDRCLDSGSTILMLTAGDSHYLCLSDEEIAAVTTAVCRQARGRAGVVAADRGHATGRAVDFARFAKSVGALCVMTMPPDWAGSTTPETLALHYSTVAAELPVMIVTNVFIPRGGAFGLETIGRAVDASSGVVSVKDDFGGDFCRQLCLQFHDRISILAGGQKINHLAMEPFGGAHGYLSTFACLVPDVAARYWSAIGRGDVDGARKICQLIDIPFFDTIKTLPGGFDAGMHAAMEAVGIAGRFRRPPYYSLSDSEAAGVHELMASIPGLLASFDGPDPASGPG